MSFAKFTDRARKVVDLASWEAAQWGDDSVDTVHLLVGMLREGQGVAGRVLTDLGIDVDTVVDAHESVRKEPDASLAEVESRCLAEAKWFNHHYAGTEHLILGVCCLPGCRAAKLLANLGQPPIELCQVVVEILGHGGEWDRWLADHPELAEGSTS